MRVELKDVPFAATVRESEFVKDKDIDQLELEASRRALALIKGRLGPKALLELVRPDVEETDRLWEAWAEESGDNWRVNSTETEVAGLDLDYWLTWLRTHLGIDAVGAAISPEHYVWTKVSRVEEGSDSDQFILVEPMGEYMLRSYTNAEEWDGFDAFVDPDFPVRMCLTLNTRNGVMVGRSISQYRETSDGFIFRMDAMKPMAVPPAMMAANAEHGRLEYHRAMELARADWCAGVS